MSSRLPDLFHRAVARFRVGVKVFHRCIDTLMPELLAGMVGANMVSPIRRNPGPD